VIGNKIWSIVHNNKIWRLWAKSLGEKHGRNDREADIIALIRTCIFVSYLVTNVFIVAGVVRHWNDVPATKNELYFQK